MTMNNSSAIELEVNPESGWTGLTVIYAILGSIGIAGNSIVLVVMLKLKELRTTTNLFIVNQSIIDICSSILLLGAYVAPRPFLPRQTWAAQFVCAIWNSNYLFWSTLIASTFNLVVLTLERYIAVVRPIFYRNKFTYRRAAIIACVPWVCAFSFESYWAFANVYEDGQCVVHYPNSVLQTLTGCVASAVTFFVPLTIMVFTYVLIMKALRQRVDDVSSAGSSTGHEPEQTEYRSRARKNVIKTLLIVCATFAICWTPNTITYLYFNLGGRVNLEGAWFYFTVSLAFVNMCVNPFIYAFKFHSFQKGLKKLLGMRVAASTAVSHSRTMNTTT